MTAPAIVIRVELEAAPRLVVDAVNEAEERRLAEALDVDEELCELVGLALVLEAKRRAA